MGTIVVYRWEEETVLMMLVPVVQIASGAIPVEWLGANVGYELMLLAMAQRWEYTKEANARDIELIQT